MVFTKFMKQNGTKVVVWVPYDGSCFSSGLNTISDLEQVPVPIDAYLWTDKIELISPKVKGGLD